MLLKWEATDRWPGHPGVCWERPEPLSRRYWVGGAAVGAGPGTKRTPAVFYAVFD